MTGDLRPYPEYKDTGLPWLGRIPAHWEVRRNGRLFAHRTETGYGNLPILEVSLKTGVRVRDLDDLKRKQVMSDREKYKRAAKGDIAYNMMRMWQGAVGVVPEDGLVSPAYVLARPYPEVEPRYFSYLFRTDAYKNEVDRYSRGIVKDRNRLYWEDFKRMPSCFPPPDEQKAIADYLDANAAKVRRFIRNRRRLIEVLNEQKQAIIDRAITRGLDPNVRLKPSGIDWLGDVPEHWEILRADHVFDLRRESLDMKGLGEDIVFHYSIPAFVKTMDGLMEKASHIESNKLALHGNELLVSKLNPHKRHVLLARAHDVRTVCSSEFVPLVPRRCFPPFALYVFSCGKVCDYLTSRARSATRSHSRVEPEAISKMWWAWPPLSEQQNMVDAIAAETRQFDQAIQEVRRQVMLIQEYRARLIADVVTGKVDVRHLAPDAVEAAAEEPEPWEEGQDVIDGQDAGDLQPVEEMADADD